MKPMMQNNTPMNMIDANGQQNQAGQNSSPLTPIERKAVGKLSSDSPSYENTQLTPTAIDLFAGCGGLTLGLKQAGFKVIGAVEIDPLAVKTYKANHPEVKMWDIDIRKVPIRQMMRRLHIRKGQLDLLAGCPPCQGFSQMRTLKGTRKVSDPNNDLVFKFLHFVKELKPKTIMMENVPDLAADNRIKLLLEMLQALGYHIGNNVIQVLDAAYFGVAQRRKRMILLVGRYGYIEFAQPDSKRCTVREKIATCPPAGESGDPLHDTLATHSPAVMERIRRIPKNGGSRTDLGPEHQLPCHQKCDGFKDVYGRMAWDDVAPTLTSGCTNPSKGRFLHPEHDRAITLREAALLQSFPSDYKFSIDRGRYPTSLLIGNALPPEFIRRHAEQVKRHLEHHIGRRHPTDVSSYEWEMIAPLLPIKQTGPGRRRTVELRDVVNALLYQENKGCKLDMLPRTFPPGTTLSYYYYEWRRNRLWQRIKDRLHDQKISPKKPSGNYSV